MMAAMGISGFGKKTKKHELKADRFDKTKRTDVRPLPASSVYFLTLDAVVKN